MHGLKDLISRWQYSPSWHTGFKVITVKLSTAFFSPRNGQADLKFTLIARDYK